MIALFSAVLLPRQRQNADCRERSGEYSRATGGLKVQNNPQELGGGGNSEMMRGRRICGAMRRQGTIFKVDFFSRFFI